LFIIFISAKERKADMLNQILKKAARIEPVNYSAALEYSEQANLIKGDVDKALTARSDLRTLIGQRPLSVMYENHDNHAAFMGNVFKLNDYELMSRVILWVYHAYHTQGFSYDYFPLAMKEWVKAVEKHLEPSKVEPISAVYRWIIDNHELFIDASKNAESPPSFIEQRWLELKEVFLASLLEGNHRKATEVATNNVHSVADLTEFYLQVIQPAMYDVGSLWAKGDISVAREHLASAIVTRVMAAMYPKFIVLDQTKGNAIVTAAPNEFHEIGPRMVADLLEIDGWDVDYTGANTPPEDLVDLALARNPAFVAVSVGMPFNIDKAQHLVQLIREQKQLSDTKIMVGGQSMVMSNQFSKAFGADGVGQSARDAVMLAAEWWENA
jgi:MerR family transcriptional regulator, light-induced transcriptional regulator